VIRNADDVGPSSRNMPITGGSSHSRRVFGPLFVPFPFTELGATTVHPLGWITIPEARIPFILAMYSVVNEHWSGLVTSGAMWNVTPRGVT
jgi:hypothetical protein